MPTIQSILATLHSLFVSSVQKEVAPLEARVGALEALLQGIERVVTPDGTVGIYIPFRVGIQTKYFLLQPRGKGTGLCVTTATDPIAVYIQHDGDQTVEEKQVKGVRTALMVRNTDPNLTGTNIGIDVIATNAPHGNVAIDAKAQYSPSAEEKLTVIEESEWKDS